MDRTSAPPQVNLSLLRSYSLKFWTEAVRHEREISMQGGKNWILAKKIDANRFFRDSHWLEIWKNHLCHSMGPNGGSLQPGYGLSLVYNYMLYIASPSGHHFPQMDSAVPLTPLVN
jgi:hypothetical protein